MEDQSLLQHDDLGQAAANQRDFIKLSDVVAEITAALKGNAEAKTRLEESKAVTFKDIEDKTKFPIEFSAKIDFRTCYKITQYLFVNGAIEPAQYLAGLKSLVTKFDATPHAAERIVLAKVKRQIFLNRANTENARAEIKALMAEFSNLTIEGKTVADKKFRDIHDEINDIAEVGSKAYVKKNRPPLKYWEVAAIYAGEVSKNIFMPARTLLELSAGFFKDGANSYREKPWHAMSFFAAGIFTGIGMVVMGLLGAAGFVLSSAGLIPGVYHGLTKPWAQDNKAKTEIGQDVELNTLGGRHLSEKAAELVEIDDVVKAAAVHSKKISNTSVRSESYDTRDGNRKRLSGLEFFTSVKPVAAPLVSYQDTNLQEVPKSPHSNNRKT
ncbi:MAG TPA: hypothetical protein VGV92_04085 [Gammaproteobacteria bacterium]|nr:hypothetical protein [Gammaproteobacteria bacterium]